MSLNWEDLKVVLALSRAGSLTGAAQLLGIDQSTAGRRLSALETDLGAVLFVRSKTGFTPTEVGERVVARALEIEHRAEQLLDDLSVADQGPAGLVRIIGNPWTMARLAAIALPPLLARHPALQVRTIGGSQSRSLARSEAAVALWFEIPPREVEFAFKLGDVPYAIYAPAGVDPDSLGWLAFWDDEAPRRAPSRWMNQHMRPGETLRLTATDSSVLLAGVRAGVGKSLLPMCLATGDPAVVRLTEGPPELVRALHLHAHPDTVQTARVQVTIQCLREAFADTFGVPELDS
ncbi:MAG: LysR family transcriptional regulator [Pseudomonadota bacterium]